MKAVPILLALILVVLVVVAVALISLGGRIPALPTPTLDMPRLQTAGANVQRWVRTATRAAIQTATRAAGQGDKGHGND